MERGRRSDFVAFSRQYRADETARAEADAIWNELEVLVNREEALEATDIVALHRLAKVEREDVREAFCRSLALDEARSRRFNRHPYPVIRAAVGVAPVRRRRRLAERVLAPALGDPIAAECRRAIVMLAVQIAADLPGLAAKAVDAALDVISETTDSYRLSALVQAVQALAPRLDRDQAAKAMDAVLDVISKTTDSYRLSALAQAVQALGPNPHQGAKTMDAVLDVISKTTADETSALAQAVQALAPRLDRDQAAKAVDAGLDAISKTTDSYKTSALAQAVQALGPNPHQGAKTMDAGLDAISKTTDSYETSELLQAVQALAPLINDESLMRAVQGLLAHLKHCASPADTAKCVSALLTTARWSDDPAFVGTVFEGLKAPMAFGEATERALQALQESFPDRADELKDLWCAADWAERTFPDLNLAAPPRWLVEDRA